MNRAATVIGSMILLGAFSVSGQSSQTQGAPPAAAQPQAQPPAQKVDPAKEADIRKLLEISGSIKVGEELVVSSAEQLKANLTRTLPEGERTQKIVESFLRRYKERFTAEHLVALMIPIYDRNMTDEDIKGLIDFYQTPLGQRAVKALPLISRESQRAEFDFGQKIVNQVVKEVQEEFPELKDKPPDKP